MCPCSSGPTERDCAAHSNYTKSSHTRPRLSTDCLWIKGPLLKLLRRFDLQPVISLNTESIIMIRAHKSHTVHLWSFNGSDCWATDPKATSLFMFDFECALREKWNSLWWVWHYSHYLDCCCSFRGLIQ